MSKKQIRKKKFSKTVQSGKPVCKYDSVIGQVTKAPPEG